jgi:hypothetical protein
VLRFFVTLKSVFGLICLERFGKMTRSFLGVAASMLSVLSFLAGSLTLSMTPVSRVQAEEDAPQGASADREGPAAVA